jgi:hypothetical protein
VKYARSHAGTRCVRRKAKVLDCKPRCWSNKL